MSRTRANDKDPVCGMTVDPESAAAQEDYQGKTWYFCSEHCHSKFQADPEVYTKPEQDHKHGNEPATGTCAEGTCNAGSTIYTCPMHPEIEQQGPGACPKCGMALEPRTVEAEEDTSELDYMTRHFRVSTFLAVPVFLSAMAAEFWPEAMTEIINPHYRQWFELLLATPVVIWGGRIFYVRAWQSVVTRNLNMFTLINLGVSVAWTYSMTGVLFPGIFPESVFNDMGVIPVYFEAVAVITALVLLG